MFKHVNPPPDRAAFAPYNFVPLPAKVFFAPEESIIAGRSHDQFLPNTFNGFIALNIETLTPMFIRGPVHKSGGQWDVRDARLRPEPFVDAKGRPVIPGSSLRGAIRNLFEILTFSKLAPVTNEQPFYRSVGTDRMGQAYRNRMVKAGRKPQGGFLRRQSDGSWVIEESPGVKHVLHERLATEFRSFSYTLNPKYRPASDLQEQTVWVQSVVDDDRVSGLKPGAEPCPGKDWHRAVLLLTGCAPRKKAEFAFLVPSQPGGRVPVPDALWKRFHDEDQLTPYQEQVFNTKVPPGARRHRDGHLYDGEPVFFVCDETRTAENPRGLVFFGRAGMFRLPYDHSPYDLLGSEHRDVRLDLTEAVFGIVSNQQGSSVRAVKSRLRFEDATATSETHFDRVRVPQILLGPKITTFQHYLAQNGEGGTDKLVTYLKGDRTALRGHKLYWHRHIDLESLVDSNEESLLQDDCAALRSDKNKTRTCMQPVPAHTTFAGRIRFENLLDFELGALLAVLALPDGCAHKIGMGKPLGLGSVRIRPKLTLIDRDLRYNSWTGTGEREGDLKQFLDKFIQRIQQHAETTNETLVNGESGLARIARLKALFIMLAWDSKVPAAEDTHYMPLAMFRNRPVLPSPFAVAKAPEPEWRGDLPEAAPKEQDQTGQGRAVQAAPERQRPPDHQTSRTQGPRRPEPPATPGRKTVRCVVLEEKTKKGGWRFAVRSTGRKGVLAPNTTIPSDLSSGMEVDLDLVSTPADSNADLILKFPSTPEAAKGHK